MQFCSLSRFIGFGARSGNSLKWRSRRVTRSFSVKTVSAERKAKVKESVVKEGVRSVLTFVCVCVCVFGLFVLALKKD